MNIRDYNRHLCCSDLKYKLKKNKIILKNYLFLSTFMT